MTTVPIIDSAPSKRMWIIDDIYTGPSGLGRYVPKVDDAVLDWNTGLYRVTAVDSVTKLSTLQGVNLSNLGGGSVDNDVLLGSGPGAPSASYRLFVNPGLSPQPMRFHVALHIYKLQADHVRVYLGHDVTGTGTPIAAMLDHDGHVTTNNIPLEQVATTTGLALGIFTPVSCYCTTTVDDGTEATAVVYDSDDNILGTYSMVIVNTNFIATADDTKTYITGIELVTPHLSLTDNTVIEIPVNQALQNLALQCRVSTLTGSTASNFLLPVDGSRVKLLGINSYTNSRAGQTSDLVLVYTLQPDEYGYDVSEPTPDRSISKPYSVTTTEADGAYSVKLFVVPTNVGGVWTLEYYLYSLDRSTVYHVTPYVALSGPSPFNPASIGVQQGIQAGINLNDIPGAGFDVYRYVQSFTITLNSAPGNAAATDFYNLQYTPGVRAVGPGIYAKATPNETNPLHFDLDLSCGIGYVDQWINHVFDPLQALFMPPETEAPVPTHVNVYLNGSLISQVQVYEAALNWPVLTDIPTTIVTGSNVRLDLVQKVVDTDYHLASVGFNVVV